MATHTHASETSRAMALTRRLLVMVGLIGFLTGCEVSNTFFTNPNASSELDQELEAILVDASGGAGMEFFQLPGSTELSKIPQDPKNPLTPAKVELGKLLFHETALATNPRNSKSLGMYSCAGCHHAAAGFQAGRMQGISEGGMGFGIRGEARVPDPDYDPGDLDLQPIRTPTSLNTAYQEVMLWNGQFGATGPNEGTEAVWSTAEHHPTNVNFLGYQGLEVQGIAALSVHRLDLVEESMVATDPTYVAMFEEAFPGMPIDRETVGLAMAAYQRTLLANAAPWQRWLRGKKSAMTDQEKRGAQLFFGKAACADCHTGPALSSMTFYALGMADLDPNSPDVNGNVADLVETAGLGRASFTLDPADNYKFKTPQIYNLLDSPFYGHGGTFNSVREVIEYKNAAIPDKDVGAQLAEQFQPLGLTEAEIDDLTAFVENALYDPELMRYVPESLPSGNCFPFNDPQARIDLGCD